jgi:peptidylprolyl isomerase
MALAVACSGGGDNSTNTPLATTQPSGTVAPNSLVAATAPAPATCPAPISDPTQPNLKTYAAAPAITIDPSKTYTATVKTVRGDITIKLRPDLAPNAVNSFVFLANEGYFNGVTFHGVVPGVVAQTGDPTGKGTGGPGYSLPDEYTTSVPFTRGVVGMASKTAPNSAGSQWFIATGPVPSLDGKKTVFGQVTDGMAVVDCLTPRSTKISNAPPGDKIVSITINEQ